MGDGTKKKKLDKLFLQATSMETPLPPNSFAVTALPALSPRAAAALRHLTRGAVSHDGSTVEALKGMPLDSVGAPRIIPWGAQPLRATCALIAAAAHSHTSPPLLLVADRVAPGARPSRVGPALLSFKFLRSGWLVTCGCT